MLRILRCILKTISESHLEYKPHAVLNNTLMQQTGFYKIPQFVVAAAVARFACCFYKRERNLIRSERNLSLSVSD